MIEAAAGMPRQHYGITLGVLTIAALAYALSQTIVAPALPAIQEDLGTSATAVSFVLTAYLVSASIATPILGRLGDMFGKERLLLIALLCFALGSLISALSNSIEMLIFGRVVQGVGGAVFPLAFAIIRDEFPVERVGTGVGLVSAMFGVGAAAGLALSGVIVDNLSYEWMFWLTLPVVALAVVMTYLFVPESPVRDRVELDWVGAALLALVLSALLVGISQGDAWGWLSSPVLALVCFAALALVVWVRFEARQTHPLVDIRMMRERPVWTANGAALFLGVGMFGSFILVPMFVQTPPESGYGFGASVLEAGLFLLPSACLMLLASPVAGWLDSRLGSKLPLTLGTGIAASSFVLLALGHDHRWAIYASSSVFGLGAGFSLAAIANLIVAGVDQQRTGIATGINTVMRMIGAAIGGQAAAAIVAASVGTGGLPAESGFILGFLFAGCGVAIAFVTALFVPGPLVSRRPLPERQAGRSGYA